MRALYSTVVAGALALVAAPDSRYADDFEFLKTTVKREFAALKKKGVDWDAVCERFEPKFASCASDAEHVKNVMEMLASLRDSHTGVTQSKVDWNELPGKADGLFGGGILFGYDDGKFVLRGVMHGHPLGSTVPLGSVLVGVGDEPAWFAMERERRRAQRFGGASTEHGFWASLSNRLLPFGAKNEIQATFLTPEKKTRTVAVPRWGPGGKSFDFVSNYLPEGVEWKEGASSAFVHEKGAGRKIGFLKITGSMDAATVKAFHAAFDALKGMDGLLLDCRSMGGGGDDSAWEMAGRLFPKATPYGRRRLEPSGAWQFDGPVVMLQDEVMVSSAETFTWAVSETRRVVSVGRPTGGWGIIPRSFPLPSGLATFRLGVSDRATPLLGVHTEGIGWPPDVLVPFGPVLSATGHDLSPLVNENAPDPVLAIGATILDVLLSGVPADEARAAFHALAEGDAPAFAAFSKKAAAKAAGMGPKGDRLAKLFADDLEAEIALERAALALGEPGLAPDCLGAARRLPRLLARAKKSGAAAAAAAAALDKAEKAGRAEAAAQEALLAALDESFTLPEKAAKPFLSKHGATAIGKFVKSASSR